MRNTTIIIDTDKKCDLCHQPGVVDRTGLCMKCGGANSQFKEFAQKIVSKKSIDDVQLKKKWYRDMLQEATRKDAGSVDMSNITIRKEHAVTEEKEEYEDEFIKYEFSEDEKRKIAVDMARLVNDGERWEDEKKQVTNDLKARGDQIAAGIRSAATKLNNGWEMRRMKCKVIRDYDDGIIRWVRPDTFDTVKERKMNPDERQMKIDEA